jgi:hypothetical protein
VGPLDAAEETGTFGVGNLGVLWVAMDDTASH